MLKLLFCPGKRSSRFYKYFFSYVLMAVIVLLVMGTVVYGYFIATLRKEVEASNISYLTRIRNTMDIQMRDMERAALHMQINRSLQAYNLRNVGYDSIEAVRQLRQYKACNSFVREIAFYNNYTEDGLIYTDRLVAAPDVFFTNVYQYENFGSQSFRSLAEKINLPLIRPAETVTADGIMQMNVITYMYPILLNSNRPYSVVLFFVEENSLKRIVEDVLKDYTGFFYILDADNKPVYMSERNTGSNTLPILDAFRRENIRPDVSEIKISGVSYSVVSVKSEYNHWSYITAIRTDQFMKKIYTRRSLLNYAILSVLILGIIAAFAFATGNYLPLRELYNMAASVGKEKPISRGTDEFTVISSILNEVSREKTGLLVKLKSKADMLRGQWLLRLLRGKYDNLDEWNNMEDTAGLKLQYPFFAVIILQIDDHKHFMNSRDLAEQDLIKFSICNVVEELAQELGTGYSTELMNEQGIALLLNIKEEYAKERYISELAFRAKEFFKQHFNITFTIGVGNIYNHIGMIRESYSEATRAIYYRLIKGKDSVIFHEEIKEKQKAEYRYPAEVEAKLLVAVKQGKYIEIEHLAGELKRYVEENAAYPEAVQCIRFGVINAVIKALEEMDMNAEECLSTRKDSLFDRTFETFDELLCWVVQFCKEISRSIEKNKESKNYQLLEKIYSIADTRYMDNNLSLEQIALECNVSSSYISRFFKNHTGYPLMQYIDQLRTEQVKEMLKKTKLPLKVILSQAGYIDPSNFMRKFKMKEGITIRQYRNIAQCGAAEADLDD